MTVSEKEFLESIARKMGRAPMTAPPPPRPGHVRKAPVAPANMSTRDQMAEWFASELAKLTGTVERAASLQAAGEAVAAQIAKTCTPGGDVVLWNDEIALSAKAPLEAAGFKCYVWPQDRWRCAGAVAGVTSATYAIAETGSIALAATPTQGRMVSLLPPLHVAIVPTSRLVATAGDYFRTVALREKMPAALNLVTGPSRTADIELELSIGVHGPENLHAVLLED